MKSGKKDQIIILFINPNLRFADIAKHYVKKHQPTTTAHLARFSSTLQELKASTFTIVPTSLRWGIFVFLPVLIPSDLDPI